MQIRLEGRAALVTGGSRGMGAAMAKKFAESGADVAIAARRPDVLEKTKAEIEAVAEGKVLACPCDMNEPDQIKSQLDAWLQQGDGGGAGGGAVLDLIVTTGGTGISSRDTTIEVVERLLDKKLEGFGELFRMLSWDEVGAAAMLSRAVAGLAGDSLIFSLPGSTNAVKLAMTKLILPELAHLIWERAR